MRWFRALLLVPLLLAAEARATTLAPVRVRCPACEQDFTAEKVMSTNYVGGVDRDLCRRSIGYQPRSFAVWTCPHCFFSRPDAEFTGSLAGRTREKVAAELRPPVALAGVESQTDIPGWLKYWLAIRVAEWEGIEPIRVARLGLEGAFAARTETGFGPALAADEGLQSALKELRKEVTGWKGPLEREGFPLFAPLARDLRDASRLLDAEAGQPADGPAGLRRLYAAFLLRLHGENLEAEPVLAGLAAAEGASAPIREAARGLLDSIARERDLQEKFLAAFAAAQGVPEDSLAELLYVAGDTQRRLGRKGEAAELYGRALLAGGGPVWVARIATEGLALVGGSPPPDPVLLAEANRKRFDALIRRLAAPETAREARQELQLNPNSVAEPGIVRCLSSAHLEARVEAARALALLPEPTDGAVDALCRVLLEDKESDPRSAAAAALARLGAPRSRPALERALADEDERARASAIAGLGIAGEAETVPLLLACAGTEEDVALALSRITNRPPGPREEFRAWFTAHEAEGRREWVRRGFREAGATIEDPWSADAVPELIRLLRADAAWIRTNAVRALREISGRRLGWDDIAAPRRTPGDADRQVSEWTRWWVQSGH